MAQAHLYTPAGGTTRHNVSLRLVSLGKAKLDTTLFQELYFVTVVGKNSQHAGYIP